MEFTPRVLGAMAAVLVGGVASGAVIGRVPPIQHMGAETVLPEARTVAIDYRQDRNLPDHYPLVTPQGRFEVHELADRGLYSQARYQPYDYDYDDYDDYDYDYDEYYAELAYAELEAAHGPETDARRAALEPLDLAEGPATIPPRAPPAAAAPAAAAVTPRTIDVSVELAALN